MPSALRSSVYALALTIASAFWAGASLAAGVGIYAEYGYSNGELDLRKNGIVKNSRFHTGDTRYETHGPGFGVIVDSNLAGDELFNYRAQLGWYFAARAYNFGGRTHRIDGSGFTLNQTFGFGAFRNADVRLWAGPAARLSVEILDDKDNLRNGHFLADGGLPGADPVIDLKWGIGPNFGLNWHLGPTASASLQAGYQYLWVKEHVDYGAKNRHYWGGEHLVTVGFSLMFRGPEDRFQ